MQNHNITEQRALLRAAAQALEAHIAAESDGGESGGPPGLVRSSGGEDMA